MLPERWLGRVWGGQPVLVMGVHDALSCLLAERSGCDAIWWSSFGLSATAGVPDKSVLEPAEIAERIRFGTRCVSVPHIVDADAGYGGARELERAWGLYQRAGATGLAIEDYPHPKISSLIEDPARELCPAETMASRLAGFRDAFGPEPILIARTEALVVGADSVEALRRAELYAAAGCDLVIIHHVGQDVDVLLDVASNWSGPVPLGAIPTTYGHLSAMELYNAGFELVILANALLRASAQAMAATLTRLAPEQRLAAVEGELMTVNDIVGLIEPGHLR